MPDWLKGPDDFDLTEGRIGKPLFHLSLPLVVTNLLQTAYNLADTYWLGQYGTAELAAISFAWPMVFLFISIGLGFAVAGSVLVAQHTGADESASAEYAASQTVSFALLASVGLGGIAYLAAGPLLTLLGASPAVQPLATSYLQIIALGLVFMFGFFLFLALLRGYGDTVTPMLVMLGTVILNIVIDPFLIFGWGPVPEYGITGAAYATVASRGVAMFVGMGLLLTGSRGLQIHPHQMVPDFGYLRRLARIGVPASIDGMGRAVSVNLMLAVVSLFPTPVVAGYGIAIRVFSLVFMPANAVERGVETMTGQNIGAGNEDRAARANHLAARTMGVLLTGVGILVWFAARPIAGLFTTDPAVVDVSVEFLRYVALTFGGVGVVRAYTGGFRGVGQTLVAAAISITMLGLVRLPVAWLGATQLGLGRTGIWIGFAVSNVVGAVLGYLWFRRRAWREVDVTEDDRPTAAVHGDD